MDLFTLEREGLPIVLKKFGLSLEKLGLKGCTLYYRRRIIDMPLTPLPPEADEAKSRKASELRKRILQNYIQKYLFQVKECLVPIDYLTENDRLKGIVFQKNVCIDNQWKRVHGEAVQVNSPLVVSSIGSVPEQLLELPLQGDLLKIEDAVSGKIQGFTNVFALGNVVTGKGNIRESMLHSRAVTRAVVDRHFDVMGNEYADLILEDEKATTNRINKLVEDLQQIPPLSNEKAAMLRNKIKELQKKSGYNGKYRKWISRHLPVRLEKMMK
jgi:hypothetical protein